MSEIAAVQPSAAEPNRIAEGVPRIGTPTGAATVIPGRAPSFFFLAVVSIVSLASDIATKFWAEKNLDGYPGIKEIWPGHLAFILARNRGGAWGLLQSTNENVRRPFFLLVSAAAIAFIVTLYRKLTQEQKALAWGLPLVLGGALGNVFDRIRYGQVIDFIDFHVTLQGSFWEQKGWAGEHHWPTFNVADIAICVGVSLMAIDMFTSKRSRLSATQPGPSNPADPPAPATPSPPEPAVPIPTEPSPEPTVGDAPPADTLLASSAEPTETKS